MTKVDSWDSTIGVLITGTLFMAALKLFPKYQGQAINPQAYEPMPSPRPVEGWAVTEKKPTVSILLKKNRNILLISFLIYYIGSRMVFLGERHIIDKHFFALGIMVFIFAIVLIIIYSFKIGSLLRFSWIRRSLLSIFNVIPWLNLIGIIGLFIATKKRLNRPGQAQ